MPLAGSRAPARGRAEGDLRVDQTDAFADRRDEIDRMQQRFERAKGAANGTFSGADASGTVTVTVTESGHFTDVRVATNWRDEVPPEALEGAVMDARTAAAMARMGEWGNALAEELDEPAPQTRPLTPVYESLAGRIDEFVTRNASPEESQAMTDAMAEFLQEVIASIDEATAEMERAQRAEIVGTSEAGHVRVVVNGTGDVVGVRFDEQWLQRAHAANIGRETVQAQGAALRAVSGRSVASVLASTRLGELEALTRDPEALARRLRMTR